MNELTLRPAVEQLRLLKEEKISPLELAQEHSARIQRLNPRLNALVDFDPERVLEQARKATEARGDRGPLHGLPVTVKSSISTAGYRCEIGSLINKGHVPAEDAPVVARLRNAGAILLGTTNCPEFLMAYETDNRLYGETRNPWNLDYSPGGSSGGESAAIAAGMSAGGLGSDSGGSVRVPAHFTGIASLKPTPGRVPGRGHLPPCAGPFSILGAIGPMARTVADVTLLFEVLSGRDVIDPVSPPVNMSRLERETLKRLRIGYFEDDGLTPVTEETRKAVCDAVRVLREQGFTVEPFRPRALEEARRMWWLYFVRCGAMFYGPTIRGKEDLLSRTFRDFLELAGREPVPGGEELLFAWAESDAIRCRLLQEMREYPILLSPVCSMPAFRTGERKWKIEGVEMEYFDVMRYTQYFNLLAAPAAVVPVGRSREGLPIGVQVAARPFHDEEALAVAAVIDREFGFVAPPGL